MLEKVKQALKLTTDAYDNDLTDLIAAALLDLGLAGVVIPATIDALVRRAVVTYCRIHLIGLSDGEFSRWKASYDEQKAQLSMATGYTDFSMIGDTEAWALDQVGAAQASIAPAG